jgi:hypothetical protein
VIVRLRKLHDVNDVSLQSSTEGASTSTTGGTCPVAWTATVAFNPETAPTVQTAVPARLGGGQ